MSKIKSRLQFVDETVAALKPIIVELEAANATLTARCARLAAELQTLAIWQAADQPRMDKPPSPKELSAIKRFAAAALTADDRALAELWRAMEAVCKAANAMIEAWNVGEQDAGLTPYLLDIEKALTALSGKEE